jgi:hypothetical protein
VPHESWQEQQDRLERNVVPDPLPQPVLAAKFRDGRWTPHEWIRVIGAGHDPSDGESYYLCMFGGSGGGWLKASEIELHPDEPAP